ncbi:hypothetical protein DBR17_00815 [Sphingomonas sp. HMWF008]|nr:hypothetical protein DBR17_00815 [Sphingomonas sp. HMWF008]
MMTDQPVAPDAREPERYYAERKARAIAVVSGKGGSGKTMVAVALARGLTQIGRRVLLVDADLGTGGLTYYLTFQEFSSARYGISDGALGRIEARTLLENAATPLQPDDWRGRVGLIPIGNQRRIDDDREISLKKLITSLMIYSEDIYDFLIVDCRGGLDTDSQDVCEACDDIYLVVETDATSIRASQHLVDALSMKGLRQKISGFILNKVMDNPTSLARSGNTFFDSQFLGAIPFDIEATRAYIQGKIPSDQSLFVRHVYSVLSRPPFLEKEYGSIKTLRETEFGSFSLRDPRTITGGLLLSLASIYFSIILVLNDLNIVNFGAYGYSNYTRWVILALLILSSLGAASDQLKTALGTAFGAYGQLARRLFSRIGY